MCEELLMDSKQPGMENIPGRGLHLIYKDQEGLSSIEMIQRPRTLRALDQSAQIEPGLLNNQREKNGAGVEPY